MSGVTKKRMQSPRSQVMAQCDTEIKVTEKATRGGLFPFARARYDTDRPCSGGHPFGDLLTFHGVVKWAGKSSMAIDGLNVCPEVEESWEGDQEKNCIRCRFSI